MPRLLIKVKTALALGPLNLIRVISYRIGVRYGLNPVKRITAARPNGEFFKRSGVVTTSPIAKPNNWSPTAKLFSFHSFKVQETPPDWHANPLTGSKAKQTEKDWWLIPDFDPDIGDIKLVWELSRFDWVIAFAQQVIGGKPEVVDRLNDWLNDWCINNPPYKGPNWKCGQEASIRVMHLAMAAVILEQTKTPSSALADLIELHLKRIEPTIGYAMAQDNNHGTSEAAALFIGGSWLALLGNPQGKKWAAKGRRWLENRAKRLIATDGSFSQYSLNYHRLMLDTFSMVEVWRLHAGLPEFTSRWQERAKAATHWLNSMVNPWNGDGPNLGANDGARLLQLTDTDYRDFRPPVQLASVLFAGSKAYSEKGVWDQPLDWLKIELPNAELPRPSSEVFDKGGFAVLCTDDIKVVLRYPRFAFRPSQADALHVDLWHKGRNLLRDAGTYSYNTEDRLLRYFPGTESHNTVQFDNRDQMPRLSRFLFGDWLKTSVFQPLETTSDEHTLTAGYCDGQGAKHTRKIQLKSECLVITDKVNGFKEKAVLRWRLEPGDWKHNDGIYSNESYSIKVESNVSIIRCEIVQGWESRYYYDKQAVPVLEVEVRQPGILTTEYRWSS